ncbi:MAG: glycosyltransferase family 2 protein [Nitrosopumilaceae archaeon]
MLIPARNEEKIISDCINALSNQILKPKKIIIVNDGSKDKTSEIASSLGCVVIDLLDDGIQGLDELKMAKVYNIGLEKLKEGFDYILELNADHILPSDYISKIVKMMEENPNLVICSGKIKNEEFQNPSIPRGSGRLIKSDFYNKIGTVWPKKYGAESYFVFKAWELGFETDVFDIITTARKTGTNYKPSTFVNIGKACKALGYNSLYALGTFIKRSIIFGNPKIFFWCLRGWFSKVDLYESNLRNFINKKQKNQIQKIIKKYFQRK